MKNSLKVRGPISGEERCSRDMRCKSALFKIEHSKMERSHRGTYISSGINYCLPRQKLQMLPDEMGLFPIAQEMLSACSLERGFLGANFDHLKRFPDMYGKLWALMALRYAGVANAAGEESYA
ncbi:hypothetical protein [Ktedonosporobacter rubrisoli]|uniref:hypothetical protein n=1 Tax=Ktedonosporobacter rubrisoli TaxID=2509675 RepID=UPI0013EE52CF|nr:hypothetical protein [Ktedonosporobacter rubrisoli]